MSTDQHDTAQAHDQAERIVLGAAMLQPQIVDELTDTITCGDFYRPYHSAIWAAITANAALGEPTDPPAIALTLAKFDDLHKLPGGAVYLHTCIEAVPTVVNAPFYAAKVAEAAYGRRAEVAALRLQQAARSGSREKIATAYDELQSELAASTSSGGDAWRTQLINGASFVYDVPDKVPTVWGDGEQVLWASGEALIVCGPQGVGKTTLAGQVVAGRLGLLGDVLGWPVIPGARRVLYLAMDRPAQAARSLQRLMRPDWRDTVHERLIVWQGPPPADFAACPTTLLEMCRAADADTVVIDSVKDAAVGLSKDEVGAGYNRARQTAIRAGVEVLELHHQRKSGDGGGKPKTMQDVYGSTWIPSGAGSVLLLWGEPGDPVVDLLHLKQPMADVGPLTVVHDHDAGTSRVDRGDFTRDLLVMVPRQPHGMTPQVAAQILYGADNPDRNQVEKARRKLEAYVRSGMLVRREGERSRGQGSAPVAYFVVERRES